MKKLLTCYVDIEEGEIRGIGLEPTPLPPWFTVMVLTAVAEQLRPQAYHQTMIQQRVNEEIRKAAGGGLVI